MILLSRNIVSPDQVLKLSLAFREAAAPTIPIISIDQEGGAVARLDAANGFSDWMSAAEMAFFAMTDADAFDYFLTRAREMMSVGINLNLGPVLDLNVNPLNPIIGALDRSFGKDPATVVRLASAFVHAHHAAGVMTCGKHFPGHGSSTTDSHQEQTDINATWTEQELVPFREMASLGNLDSVMTSHVIHRRFSDGEDRPVSLSRKGTALACAEIGFDGPILTDDLQMRAITDHYGQSEAAVAALKAGNTFLIYANHREANTIDTAAEVNSGLRAALSTGELDDLTLSARQRTASLFFDRVS